MLKIFSIFIYTLGIRVIGSTMFLVGLVDYHHVFPLFVVMILLPELVFTFVPKFRKWIKDGIEDGDGVLNTADFKSLMVHYSTLWCIRLFVIFGLLEAFYGIQVREIFVIGSLSGAFGIEFASFMSRTFKKNDN